MKLALSFLLLGLPLGLLLNLTPDVSAQSNACVITVYCEYDSIGGDCIPHAPPGAFNCWGMDFTGYCSVRTNQCAPKPETPRFPSCPSCSAGSPINLANGNVYLDQVDVNLPGLGGGLKLVRSWNSLWPPTQSTYRTGMFGPGAPAFDVVFP